MSARLINDASVGTARLDLEYRFVEVNEAFAEIHSISVAEHLGRTVEEIVPEAWAVLEPIFARVRRGETFANSEIINEPDDEDEEPRSWFATYFPIVGGGTITGIGIITQEVTARRAVEEALLHRGDLFAMLSLTSRAITSSATEKDLFARVCSIAVEVGGFVSAWIAEVRDDGSEITAWSGIDDAVIGPYLHSAHESRGPTGIAMRTGSPSIVNDNVTSVMTAPWRALAEENAIRSSGSFPIRDGGVLTAVLTVNSAVTGYFTEDLRSAIEEITLSISYAIRRFALERDRVRDEAALRLRDRAIAAVSQGIIITDGRDPEQPIIFASESLSEITGYANEEIVGRNCRFLQGDLTDARSVAELRAAIAEQKSCAVEILNYRKDGESFWNNLMISPVFDESRALANYVGVVTDVTERKLLEAQLAQAQKLEAVGVLAGGIAHDFNNMLLVIRGHSGLLLRQLTDEGQRTTVRQIDLAAERAAEFTQQLLAYSRQQNLTPQVVNVNAIVEEMLKLVSPMVGEDVELTVMLDPDLPPVLVDRAQIRQVMLNLIANSREAMPNGGTIKVITSLVTLDDRYAVNHEGVTPGPHVVLQIVDTGTGMDRRTRDRIFDPYFTTKAHGTGLGLATVYGIIKQSGGHIWVYSEPGMGTTFKCHFPVAEGASPAVVEASPEPLAFDGTETILLVEDDPAVRPLIARIISSFGYTVIEAENGVEALEIVDRYDGPIDLVFTDVVMPTMNGRELSEQLAAKKPGIKVLFTSGYPADEVIRRGIADASSLFIEKPYVPDDLARKLREIFTGGVAPSE